MSVNVFVRVCVSLHESLSISLCVCVCARARVCMFLCMNDVYAVCVCVCDSLKLCGLSTTNFTSYLSHRCYVSEIESSFTLSAFSDLTEGHSRHQRRLHIGT